MQYVSINPDLVPLLEGLKPFLPVKGKVVTEGLTSLIQVLTSRDGQNAVQAMSEALTTFGPKDQQITVNTAGGPISLSLGVAAILFLIFILLILGSLVVIGTGIANGYVSHEGPISAEMPDPVVE